MSAFIVKNKTINTVVNKLAQLSQDTFTGEEIKKLTGFDLTTQKDCERLANKMYVLNVSGVSQRYGKADDMVGETFEYYLGDQASDLQVYKNLNCFLYQCNEGDNTNSNLYKVLSLEIKFILADEIICKLSEYNKCEWD